jgi:hypothetical protein
MTAMRPSLLLLATVMLVLATALRLHVHLCFDGQEPASQLHLLDSADDEHHEVADTAHDDLDLDPLGEPLVGKLGLDLPAIALIAVLSWVLAARAAPLPRPLRTNAAPPDPPLRRRPPARAPPR